VVTLSSFFIIFCIESDPLFLFKTASTFPSRIGPLSAAWSFSFWSAHAIE
jgi:hypothetical protein